MTNNFQKRLHETCLVTGGLGFVGSHLVDFLVDKMGYSVTVIDNLSSDSSSRNYKRDDVEYWIDDIRNLGHVKYADRHFNTIYHLAALARIQPSFLDPVNYFSIDALGTACVCEYAKRLNAKIVYAGSSSAYAGHMLNPYSFAKFTGEQICEMFSKVYNLKTVTARFFNVYGDRQPTTGPYATVVGIFKDQFEKGKSFTVTGDGNQRRDFTHVNDIVHGLCRLSTEDRFGEIYNLGSGKNYSINEVVRFFDEDPDVEFLPKRPGEAQDTLADIKKMTKDFGWNPTHNLEDYIQTIVYPKIVTK